MRALPIVLLIAAGPGKSVVPPETRQLLLVRTAEWAAPTGTLTRWERGSGRPWRQVGPTIPVVVGAGGLAWGRGLHGWADDGPVKKEGDKCGAAGVFRVGEAFGFAERPDPAVRLRYRPLTGRSVCVDDPRASEYNTIVELPSDRPPPWTSGEHMRRAGAAYRMGVFIEQNSPDARPGAGSCLFLHVSPRGKPTSGCTAMSAAHLETVIGWLRPEASPVLVQAPASAYAAKAPVWGAPVVEQ